MTNRQNNLVTLMNDIDTELGIGLGIKIQEDTDVDKYVELFLHEFTVEHDFIDLLSMQDYINESTTQSLLEKIHEI